MGLYYKQKTTKTKDTVSIVLFSIVGLVLLCLILPFLKPVATFLYGIFGLAIFLYLTLLSLIAVAKLKGRRFYMSTKNIVYLTVSAVLILALTHTIFFGNIKNFVGSSKFSKFGETLQAIMQGKAGVTAGGIIITFVSYPFMAVLGSVGAGFVFGIGATVFVGLTVDYYVNLKGFYEKQRSRRERYKNATPLPSSDTIEGNLAMLNNTSDVAPKKLDSKDYDNYYNPESDDEPMVDIDTVVETGEEPLKEELDPQEEFNKRLFSGINIKHDDDDNLSKDELANSNYSSGKFSSPTEYIKTKYMPARFRKDKNEEKINDFSNTDRFKTDETLEETAEDTQTNRYNNTKEPFVFTPIDTILPTTIDIDAPSVSGDGDFVGGTPRENISNSPFTGYTPDTRNFGDRRGSRPERPTRDGITDVSNNNPFTTPLKASTIQVPFPDEITKPKKYKQESDAKYNAPPTSLLDSRPDDPTKYGSDYEEKSRSLEAVLSSFKIDAKVTDVTRGPSVTQYELAMPFGISVKRVLQYDGDITAALRSRKGVRIEAPIAGKNAVGVEVPNDAPSTVGLRELLESNEFQNSKAILPFVVGKNIYGETIIKSLPKMVHMLVAGSTGSGKSVFLHSILLSLMYKCSPSQLRFILIDPKRVEFTIYSGMPHMMLPNAVSNCEKAINALGWAVKEMERRFDSFQTLSVQNIEDFNHCDAVKSGEYQKLPYIVIVIDELNELMIMGKKEVEEKITRLSQLGRASGIHMIIATQRPSADVVTGTIKNNLPTRVAFALQSGIDSRVILDEIGAEKLLGRGDMLLAPYDDNVTSRVQGAFMSMTEVRKVVDYIKEHNESYFDEEVEKEILADKTPPPEENGNSNILGNLEPDEDELLPVALKLCIDSGGASINMIQRRFRVGYARAARIIDQMELAGYISPGNGSKLRTVYMSLDEYHEKFGEDN